MDYISRINRPAQAASCGLNCLSLFSGILGIDLGFERAGFRSLLAVDLDRHTQKTTRRSAQEHLPHLDFINANICNLEVDEILELSPVLQDEDNLVIVGGPPCQPFSKSGGRTGLDSEKGLLFREYIRLLSGLRPRAFLLENVRGLYSSNGGSDFRQVIQEFREAGYFIYWKVLDAANYGIPQFRQRLFIVGFRNPIQFSWPTEDYCLPAEEQAMLPMFSNLPFVTAGGALANLPDSGDLPPKISGRYAHLIENIPPGLNYSFYTKERGHPSPEFAWRSKFWYFLQKAHPDKPCLTIQAFPGSNTGPFHWDSRRFSLRELLRLQSFPDWWHLDSGYWPGHRVIGNAVPPLLAETIAVAMRSALETSIPVEITQYEQGLLHSFKTPMGVRSGKGTLAP